MAKKYIIDETELLELLTAYYELIALENGGVDNWSWYSDACHDFKKEFYRINPDFQKFLKKEKNIDNEDEYYEFSDIAEANLEEYQEIKENGSGFSIPFNFL